MTASVDQDLPVDRALAVVQRRVGRDAGFDALLDAVISERLQGVLWRHIDSGRVVVSDAERDRAKEAYRAQVAHTVELFGLLLRVKQRLADAEIDFLVLKGLASATLDHAHPHDRLFADLDLLVRSRDLDEAVAAVEALGGVRELPPLRPGYDARFAKSVMLRVGRLEIDLHRTIAAEPFGVWIDEDALWESPEPFAVGRHTFLAMSAPNRFLHAAYHAVLGVDDRVLPLADVATLAYRVAAEEVLARVERWKGGAVLARALGRAEALVGGIGAPELSAWGLHHRPGPFERLALRLLVDRRPRQAWRTLLTLPFLAHWPDRAAYLRSITWPSKVYLRARGTTRTAWLGKGRRGVTALGRPRSPV